MKKVSCIIPAYNEEKGIRATLEVVTSELGKSLYEVIVVDDASQDRTKSIIREFPAVRLIEHVTNGGKSRSVADGIRAAEGECVFLLDADLKFLKGKNIEDLIRPVQSETADVALSYIKNAWPLFPFKRIDYLSGQRVLTKEVLLPKLDDIAALPSYGLEVFLNKIIIHERLRLAVVQWPNVENEFNQHKHGWFEGVKIIAKIWMNVISTVGVIGMYAQNIRMQRLLVS